MLQSIRNKSTSWFALAIIFLALFSLTFFGIGDYVVGRTDTHVAKVGNEEIDQTEFRRNYDSWRQNMRAQMGENYDASLFDQPMFRRQILDSMIDQSLLRQSGERQDMVVATSAVRSAIADEPAFQVDGRFDAGTYRTLLSRIGFTPERWQEQVRKDMAARLLPSTVSDTALVADAEVDAYLRLSEQTRDFAFLPVSEPVEPISEEVGDEEVQAYYDDNTEQFMLPEQVSLEYLELTAADVVLDIEPSEDDLRQRYEVEQARFGTPEERLASHILIRPESEDADGQRAAVARAEEIADLARAEGADFEALAREHSADIASSEQGGDLGWLLRGLTDPAFEDALFELDEGAISGPVRSDDGYHIIWLRELRPGSQQSFEEVRDILRDEYLSGERERAYADSSGRLIDLIYQDPGSLQPAAEEMGLEIKRAGPFTRTSMSGLFAHANVRQAAFSDEVLLEGNASDALTIGENHMVLIRVSDHEPSRPRPLEEVADSIRGLVVAERRADAVRTRAEALFERLEAGEALAEIGQSQEIEVQSVEGVTRQAVSPDATLVAEVFRLRRPQDDAPVRALASLGGTYALVELTTVADGDPETVPAARREQVQSQLRQSRAQAESQGLLAGLRERTRIDVIEQRLQ